MNNAPNQNFSDNLETLQDMILQTLKLQCEIAAAVNALKTDYLYAQFTENQKT